MESESIVERVKLAVFPILSKWAHQTGQEGRLTTEEVSRAIARAAISAMREPTEEMWVAGEQAADVSSMTTTGRGRAGYIWRDMIDAALK